MICWIGRCENICIVANKAQPEGLIVKAHIMNECLTFCSIYLWRVETKFTRPQWNIDGDDILTN